MQGFNEFLFISIQGLSVECIVQQWQNLTYNWS